MTKIGALVLPTVLIGMACTTMHSTHHEHRHVHGLSGDPHVTVQHEGHLDYLHDGHLHHPHNGHYDEHRIAITPTNPERCTRGHGEGEHSPTHQHGRNCGHAAVPHGTHTDYLVAGHLHSPHNGHCDDHGDLSSAK